MPLQFLPEESLHSIEKSEILPSIFFEGIVRTVTHILEEGVWWWCVPTSSPGFRGRASIDGAVGGRHFPSSHPGALPRHHSAGPAAVWSEGGTAS